MLAAHLVPGYFAAVHSQSQWHPEWSHNRRVALWSAAIFSTFAPDLDVIYNGLFRGFFNHSTLWTHSIFVHSAIVLGWLLLRRIGRWHYFQTLVGLAAIGGVSHLLLDVIAHGTTLLYPLSLRVFVAPFAVRVLEGGFLAYVTDPIFLAEPILSTLALAHWIAQRRIAPRFKNAILVGLVGGLAVFTVAFLLMIPTLQNIVAQRIAGYCFCKSEI
ncbi:MAG: hypothetical protein HY868_23505 [Chloroflexi bacterium]|nr:hypothetical protein [Chloroflexota bacterium]